MSIRLDPRRLGVLKHLAGEAGVRPGDLVRQWIEERIDAARQGVATPEAARDLATRLAELADRVATLESAAGVTAPSTPADPPAPAEDPAAETRPAEAPQPVADAEPAASKSSESPESPEAPKPRRERAKRVAARPSGLRVALHDEMIAVLAERGPMSAADLATAIAERGRYVPPRSGKPLDAAMVSQRVSNPVYRARFTRNAGRIGLAEQGE